MPGPIHSAGQCLRYSWPRFLEASPGRGTWKALHEAILRGLQQREVLFSRAQPDQLCKPTALYYVPARFRFDRSTLFDSPSNRERQLSFRYDNAWGGLSLLNVKVQDVKDLYHELNRWVAEYGHTALQEQSDRWHTQMAEIFVDKKSLKQSLKTMPIIPLRDGSWAHATSARLYLPPKDDEHIPTGVSILLVDDDASLDPNRRRFFQFLDIPEYNPREVCKLILKIHGSDLETLQRDEEDLISDAVYLFVHRHIFRRYGAPDIVFVARRGHHVVRERTGIYCNGSAGSDIVAKHQDDDETPFSILDSRYTEMLTEADQSLTDFYRWLLSSTSSAFRSHPALSSSNQLTAEWKFLRDKCVLDLLFAIKHVCSETNHPLLPEFIEAVQQLEIPCLDGTIRQLGCLAIPAAQLLQECPHLPFADLPDPTRAKWGFLSKFGVITQCHTKARLLELDALAALPIGNVDKDHVHSIYRALNRAPESQKQRIW